MTRPAVTVHPDPFQVATIATLRIDRSAKVKLDLVGALDEALRGAPDAGERPLPSRHDAHESGIFLRRVDAGDGTVIVPMVIVR